MDSTYFIGLLLVGFSAFLLALHWQQFRQPTASGQSHRQPTPSARRQDYHTRMLRRRTVASSLVGLVGVSLMAFETVPRTPLSITAYLLALVLMTCWILWLACLDLWAGRRYHEEQQLEEIAQELKRAETGEQDSPR